MSVSLISALLQTSLASDPETSSSSFGTPLPEIAL
jgi:hypothetical protein